MFEIIKKKELVSSIVLMDVIAPRVARAARPGQFLIVRVDERGERIPLTICDYDREKGTVTIVTQIVGASSRKICRLNAGDSFSDFAGPLGKPSEFVNMDMKKLSEMRFIFIAGGLGAAPVYPQVKYLHSAGAKIDVIIGAKNRNMVILEDEMTALCDNLYVCTDDGSYGEKGLVTDILRKLIMKERKYDQAVAIGPMVMMKFVALTAKEYNLPLMVSLNTLMVDGTGMCGACRVSVGGETKFACVDGPEFDAYMVDFDEALRRQGMYRDMEMEADHRCKIDLYSEK